MIETEADFKAALFRANALMDADFGTPEGEELDLLVDLMEHCEDRHLSLERPTAMGAPRFRMEQEK